MSTLIRGGTVVNHDHSARVDVLIDGGKIIAMGGKLSGATTIDAGGCYVMPGGIDPHTHMELMFMGNVSADDFEWGTKAALSGGTTMIVDFCIPAPGESMLAAYQAWRHKSEKAATDYSFHMAVTSWSPQVHYEMLEGVDAIGLDDRFHFIVDLGAPTRHRHVEGIIRGSLFRLVPPGLIGRKHRFTRRRNAEINDHRGAAR